MNTSNQKICFKGAPIKVTGRELHIGDTLPQFKVTANDMSDLEQSHFAGKVLILCTVPSVDTPVCAVETRRFNQDATTLSNSIEVLTVSMDLPFAQARWCAAEGITRVRTASDYKYRSLGESFGVVWQDAGLLARAVFVVGKDGKIKHVEYVADITQEPDYTAALAAASRVAA